MSAQRTVPVLLLGILALAALGHGLGGKKNQTFNGVIVLDVQTYEFYPDAKGCNYRGTPYVLLPNARLRELVPGSTEHLEPLFQGTWRAKVRGEPSYAAISHQSGGINTAKLIGAS